MENDNKKLEISPEQLETMQNLSANLAVGQNALTKLLAGQTLEDLPTSERQVVEKLLKPETYIETSTQPTPTSTSSETAQVVKNTQAETKKQINPETAEQLSEQQKQIIDAWQKASEFAKKMAADKGKFLSQMDSEELRKLSIPVIEKFKEELGPLGKQTKWLEGGKIACIPCTDDEDIEWYAVLHPAGEGTFTAGLSRFFHPEKGVKVNRGRDRVSKFGQIKPLAIRKDALFNPMKDKLGYVERIRPGIIGSRKG